MHAGVESLPSPVAAVMEHAADPVEAAVERYAADPVEAVAAADPGGAGTKLLQILSGRTDP